MHAADDVTGTAPEGATDDPPHPRRRHGRAEPARRRPGCSPTGSPRPPSTRCAERGADVEPRRRRAARARPRPGRQPAHRLPAARRCARRSTRSTGGRRADRRHADLHARRTAGCSSRSSTCWTRTRWPAQPVLIGATGGTARHSLALEHAAAPAVRLPARRRRADRGLRRHRGLGRRRRADGACATGSSGPPGSWPTRSAPAAGRRPADPFALTTDFLQMLGRGDGGAPVT